MVTITTNTKNATLLGEDGSAIINIRAELEWACSQQRARVEKLLVEEGQQDYNPEIRKEMKLEADLLKQLTDLYFALGALKKAPKVTTVKDVGQTTTIESEGRTHVLLSLQRSQILEEAEKELMTLLKGEFPDSLLH